MKIKGNEVIFDIDSKSADSFKLAMNVLGKDPDEAFGEWLHYLNNEALKSLSEVNKNGVSDSYKRERRPLPQKLGNDVIRSRINRWARNKSGSAYRLIRIFFEIQDEDSDHEVKREEMKRRYYEECGTRDETSTDAFIATFRQMCSSAARAYGLIFKYLNDEGQDLVILHPDNEEFILSLKDEFLT